MPPNDRVAIQQFVRYSRGLTGAIVVLGLVGAVVLGLTFPDDGTWYGGWVAGNAVGLVVFRRRLLNTLRLPDLPPEAWGAASLKVSLTSLALMAGVLVVSVFVDFLNPYAVCCGMLVERAVLIGDGFLRPAALSDVSSSAADAAEKGEEA